MNNGEIILYQPDNSISIEVLMEAETVWLNLSQMAMLFDRDKSVISRNIRNIYSEGELRKEATVAKNATVQKESGQ
ncbi:MAG: death-on-curing protein [Bacteroidales bacterium]|nr:death-on-curing protein [Bacteroidales bacterium]